MPVLPRTKVYKISVIGSEKKTFPINEKVLIDNDFKDFLSIIQFCRIVRDLAKNNVTGIYNVSISNKYIFLKFYTG